ncbi:hypothetical protein [Brevibacterium album]|uniref:hypothetical protein n=1 Tax=Brevibacterium album TaxID=417948 RepID=UPI00040FA079|nr:hypothetical protein [Brevibacterium album]
MDESRLNPIAERAFRVAARAPSAHNTQPWRPAVVRLSPLTVRVAVDPARTLPLADPLHMDTLLGMGCWTEAFSIACAEAGARARLTAVTGAGPQTVLTLEVTDTGAADPGRAVRESSDREAAVSGSAAFRSAEVHARQVDRGRLEPDDTALADALAEFSALTELSAPLPAVPRPAEDRSSPVPPAVLLAQIPEPLWARLNGRAALHIAQTPAMLRETLDWLRLDPADPRWAEDGLTADCLRLPRWEAAMLRRLLESGLGRELTGGAEHWQPPLARVLGGLRQRLPGPRSAPARLVLGTRASDSAAGVSAQDWVVLGRSLLRLWLVLARHGLKVSVQSELKDSPASAALLAGLLGERGVDAGAPRSRAHTRGEAPVPFAVFSVGRSTGPVPRSHRLTRPAERAPARAPERR